MCAVGFEDKMPFLFCLVDNNANASLGRIVLNDSTSKAKAEICLFGATVTSWQHGDSGVERLFVSTKAILDGSKAIRGGIPVVFPQFGQPKPQMSQHGFARNSLWTVKEGSVLTGDESCAVVLTLSDSDSTRAVFPHRFVLEYKITLTKCSLTCSLACTNTDSSEWECHTLLHTYLAVPSVHDVRVSGFQGRSYEDKVKGGQVVTGGTELALVDREVDKVFVGAVDAPMNALSLLLQGAGSDSSSTVTSEIAATLDGRRIKHDVVFWNAWIDKARALADLGDDDYLRYVCIEPGTVSEFVVVPPGQTLTLSQTLS